MPTARRRRTGREASALPDRRRRPPAVWADLRATSRSEGAVARAGDGFRWARAAFAGRSRFKRLFPKNPKIEGEWWRKRGVRGENKRGSEGVEPVQNGIGVCEIAAFRAKDRLRYWHRKSAIFAAAQALLRFSPQRWWRRFRRSGRHPEASASAQTRHDRVDGLRLSGHPRCRRQGVTGPKRTASPDIGGTGRPRRIGLRQAAHLRIRSVRCGTSNPPGTLYELDLAARRKASWNSPAGTWRWRS